MDVPTHWATYDISHGSFGAIEWKDGRRFRAEGYVEGACPTDVCGAVCCKISSLKGVVGEGPCEFLDEDDLCRLHKWSVHCKPVSCMVWPTSQASIDTTNETAERLGLEVRCQLKMVEVSNGDSS